MTRTTTLVIPRSRISRSFNPRARVGRDFGRTIHSYRYQSFNPRARVGRDIIISEILQTSESFQSTRPRGARHPNIRFTILPHVFQSTRPRGARLLNVAYSPYLLLFQSTRPRGARPQAPHEAPENCRCFNPRARVGRDNLDASLCHQFGKFQSTRPRGARLLLFFIPVSYTGFNPRARVGRDMSFVINSTLIISFNPRARVGRDEAIPALKKHEIEFQSTRPRGARLRWVLEEQEEL